MTGQYRHRDWQAECRFEQTVYRVTRERLQSVHAPPALRSRIARLLERTREGTSDEFSWGWNA
jgi:hypothetical protein